jgi:predicted membrane channel-forming protein YqfA (hemolysin III family)
MRALGLLLAIPPLPRPLPPPGQILGLVLSIIGIVFSISEVYAGTHFTRPHHIVGLVLVILAVLQPVNAIFRAKPAAATGGTRTAQRGVWELVHKGGGYAMIGAGVYQVRRPSYPLPPHTHTHTPKRWGALEPTRRSEECAAHIGAASSSLTPSASPSPAPHPSLAITPAPPPLQAVSGSRLMRDGTWLLIVFFVLLGLSILFLLVGLVMKASQSQPVKGGKGQQDATQGVTVKVTERAAA